MTKCYLSLSLSRVMAISFRTLRASCDYFVLLDVFHCRRHSKGLDIQLGYGLKFLSENPLGVWNGRGRWRETYTFYCLGSYLLNRKVNTAHEVHLGEENYQITHTRTHAERDARMSLYVEGKEEGWLSSARL